MSNCQPLPWTCGICICNPAMCAVGVSAATANPGNLACGSVSCCGGNATVTVAGSATNLWPWLIGGGLALWLLMRKKR
jgi:hypothetical protein